MLRALPRTGCPGRRGIGGQLTENGCQQGILVNQQGMLVKGSPFMAFPKDFEALSVATSSMGAPKDQATLLVAEGSGEPAPRRRCRIA